MQLWSAMQSGSSSILPPSAVPQAPLAATPDILDLLGTMADHHKIAQALKERDEAAAKAKVDAEKKADAPK